MWGPEATDSFVPLAGVVGRADTPSQLTKEGQAEPGRRGTGAGSSPQAVRAQANDALVLPPEAQQDVGMQEAQARAWVHRPRGRSGRLKYGLRRRRQR